MRSARTASMKEMKEWALFFLPLMGVLGVAASRNAPWAPVSASTLQSFAAIFISIVLEAMPFVLLGVFVSSLIQFFVSEEMITRRLPRGTAGGLVAASLLGFVFPICECSSVPIMRRLVHKGVPLHVGVTFMMAAPIVNPVVLLSTYYAFGGNVLAALVRAALGMLGAMAVGYAATKGFSRKDVLLSRGLPERDLCGCGHHHVHEDHGHDHGAGSCCCCDHEHGHETVRSEGTPGALALVENVLRHTGAELFSVGRFLILGAFISALAQTGFSWNLLTGVGQHPVLSVVVMMILAFVLSLCSEADAFVARTFVGAFSPGAVTAFILLGPMIDVKNVLMLLEGFRGKFVLFLTGAAFAVCFVLSVAVNIVRF